MIPANLILARRLQVELQELARSVHRAQRAWQAAARAGSDQDLYLDSVALNLHSFYSGVEKACEVIALQLDGGLPKGEAWHRDLLTQMALDVPGVRPPLCSASIPSSGLTSTGASGMSCVTCMPNGSIRRVSAN